MLDELLDLLDAMDERDVTAAAIDDILLVCRHPVFKLLKEFCDVVAPVGEDHGHEVRNR